MPQSPIIKGIVSIYWGAGSLLATPSGAIVDSFVLKPIGLNEKIMNNPGATATTVLLDDGFDLTVKCLYDGNKTWPAFGATVVAKIPGQATGADQAAMTTSLGAATGYNCLVVKPPIFNTESGRKKETMITLELEYRPDLGLT